MMDDWVDLYSVLTDDIGDAVTESKHDADIAAMYFAIDADYLYIMIRTTSVLLSRKNISYSFNLYNQRQNNIMFFDLLRENNSSKYASYKENFWPNNSKPATEWRAMYSKMIVKTGDVLEIAIPLDVLKSSPYFSDELKFYFAARQKTSQTIIDDIEHININFPQD